jgi:hypothetical protein
MTAFNVVRFRVKPGNEQRFIDEHRKVRPGFKGFLGGSLIKMGTRPSVSSVSGGISRAS